MIVSETQDLESFSRIEKAAQPFLTALYQESRHGFRDSVSDTRLMVYPIPELQAPD